MPWVIIALTSASNSTSSSGQVTIRGVHTDDGNFPQSSENSSESPQSRRLELERATKEDPFARSIRQAKLHASEKIVFQSILNRWTMRPDSALLYYSKKVYIPQVLRLQILREHHDDPFAGHFDFA